MNKWKVAFWCSMAFSVIVIVFAAYILIDQAYAITYHKVDYADTESDCQILIDIINNTDLTKEQVENTLRDHANYEYMDFTKDTISLNKISLIFDSEKLMKVYE